VDIMNFLMVFNPIQFKKGEVILKPGETCKHLYYILRGSMRCCMLDENGKEINIHFYFEEDLASEFKSLRTQEPSDRMLVAMEPFRALRALRQDYIGLLESNADFLQAAMRFFQELFFQEEQHSEMLRGLDSNDRYAYVMEHKPHFLQRVPLTQLASWLGMSRESLSRIRAKQLPK